jgi:hypothetical protein
MNAKQAAFSGLIDYAGLYPPAALDMPAAVRNYLDYRASQHASVLGRFIVEMSRLDELRDAAGDQLSEMRLSVIAPASPEAGQVAKWIGQGFRIESVEIKCDEPLRIARVREHLPAGVDCYFEVPVHQSCSGAIDAIAAVDARAKLRMGGTTAEAFPSAEHIAERLHLLTDRRVPFKATAGLHHPIRSQHPLTYADDSPTGIMHGFMNVLCATAYIHFGGDCAGGARILQEQDAAAFRVTPDAIAVRGHSWDADQLREVRECFSSFGSCSFTEPTHELEGSGWL